MALLKYFAKQKETNLPDPSGALSREVPSSAIVSANKVQKIASSPESTQSKKRGPYSKSFSPQVKAEIGRYAAENGVGSTLRRYVSKHPDLKESTVRTWRNVYTQELKKRVSVRSGTEAVATRIQELPSKKRGRPYLLGEELDKQVRSYLIALRERGGVVNTAIVLACAEGIIKNYDSNILAANGGHLVLTRNWGKSILSRMGFVKRRVSTTAKISVANFEEVKAQFLLDIKVSVEMDEIPPALVINLDQTGIHYVPAGSWTMDKEGAKRVEIVAADDKRQITAVFAGTQSGDFLPPQLIYKGTTHRCLPTMKFPDSWDVTHSQNHWSNEKTMIQYVEKILLPYIKKTRSEMKLHEDQPALLIFDQFKGQVTEKMFQLLEENHVNIVLVPANCNDRLQPLDISVNKPVKSFLRKQFQEWYAQKICDQLREPPTQVDPVDLWLSIVKPLGARWMVKVYDYMKSNPEIIRNGFKGAGITDFLGSS